jgi:hypothetical protein
MMAGPEAPVVTAKILLPVTREELWPALLDLDLKGPWCVHDVWLIAGLGIPGVRQIVDTLVRGGLASVVHRGPQPGNGRLVNFFRLTSRPAECPRVSRKGEILPETERETLWRTMKMLKAFTAVELAELASSEQRRVSPSTAAEYLRILQSAGVVAAMRKGIPNHPTRYRLVQNLGARAPRTLHASLVFDPNSRTVLGTALAKEPTS